MKNIKLGTYRHFKSNEYKVIGTVKHSETEEVMVLYYPLYGDEVNQSQLWVRPLDMFTGFKEVNGDRIKRFEYVERS